MDESCSGMKNKEALAHPNCGLDERLFSRTKDAFIAL
jgi:hypothetical protein